MAKALVIGTALALGTGLTIAAIKLSGKANAANNLKLNFNALNIKKVTLKNGVDFEVILSATNPSTYPLQFTQPFVVISIVNSKNEFVPISQSQKAETMVNLPARQTTELRINLNITPAQALKLPNLIAHLVNKTLGLTTNTKKLLVEYATTSSGININQKQDVVI